ncbi:MAG TPA: hypothetical protein VLQ48_16055 [Chloroflexia bacterium]|nr:hypothetical protein [Chloroflexia bacterium]
MKIHARHTAGSAPGIMKAKNMDGGSQLFLVRLWASEVDGPEWCGKVQHVISGEACDFSDWPTLVSRLQEMLSNYGFKE